MASRRSLTTFCFALLLFPLSPAHAFTVTPMLGEIDLSRSGSTTVRIANDGDTVLRVEAKVFERKQDGSGDYPEAPTKTLITFHIPVYVYPKNPVFSLARTMAELLG